MKKLILALALLVAPGFVLAQATSVWVPWNYSWVRWDGGTASGSSSSVGPYSGTPVLGDLIYFDGTNWVSLNKPADGTYSIKFTSSIPSYTAASAGGAVATDTIWTAVGQIVAATGNAAAAVVAPGTTGQELFTNGAAAPSWGDAPNVNRVQFFEDFNCRPEAITRLGCGDMVVAVGGTGAGGSASHAGVAATANTFGILEETTGSTTTGGASVGGDTESLLISGGETVIWRVYVPVASGGTNTFKVTDGLCDQTGSTAGCVDGLFFTWDNNSDTHWVTNACSNSVCNATTSSTVATAAAWHDLEIDVNAGATTITYIVDGVSIGTQTTDIPTGAGRGTGVMAKIIATAGCASATTCVQDLDFVKFTKTVTR